MTKFIIENKNSRYTMSFIDDYLPTSTSECESLDESIYDMSSIFQERSKKINSEMTESMTRLKYLCDNGKLPIELIGINLINSDSMRNKISKKFGEVANEYLDYVSKRQFA